MICTEQYDALTQAGRSRWISRLIKEDIRRMERTLSVNYPVLRQNKRVLLYTFAIKPLSLRFLCVHSIYLSILASRINVH